MDLNGNVTNYAYPLGTLDTFDRLGKTAQPDGGSTVFVYGDTPGSMKVTASQDRDGFAVWSKRLEEGTYAVPCGDGTEERRREITAQELGALLSGIDLQQATRRKRYRRSI